LKSRASGHRSLPAAADDSFFLAKKKQAALLAASAAEKTLQAVFYFTSGILQSSPVCLPHTVHSPISFFSIGLLLAQVPLNSLPVTICLRLMRPKEMKNTPKISPKMYKNSIVG
jgi:hypothetical protein